MIISWYLHVPAYVGARLLHNERRVPSLCPSELAFRLCDDRPHPEGMAVLGEAFPACRPTRGSSRPEATVVADERALAAVLRARYIVHGRAVRARLRAGQRALQADAPGRRDRRAGQLSPVDVSGGPHGKAAQRKPRAPESQTLPWCSNRASRR
jgi:hypothetical protein